MEHGKLKSLQRDDFIFAGAIFMSNRETKLECLQRKLFGLPLSKSKFLKQVKAGMILFLFEHEERKLYGVFEATSDGALNIIPDAFRSTGKSYPAQILFKRIWMCKPVCEDEFCNAIKENYYSPNKFHFGLSYQQVVKLIHLFHSRKINIKQYKGRGIPNKIIEKFENPTADDGRLTDTGTYFKYKSDDYSIKEKREARRQLASPQASSDPPMLYKMPASTTNAQHTVANTGRGPNQVNLCHLSSPENSYSETLNSERCSICLSRDHTAFYHFSVGKQPSTTSEIEYKPLPLHSSCYMSNLDNMVDPYLIDVNHHSSSDTVACELPCNDPRMVPRMVMVQEEDAFTILHVKNDLSPQTEVLQHACVSGAQPNQVFEFPDYIPLVEESQQKLVNRENQNFSLENSEYFPSTKSNSCIPSTCKEIPRFFCSADGYSDDDELKTYQRTEADEYNAASCKFHEDSDLIRTSVFTRLSRYQKIGNHETPEPSSGEPSQGLSLDEFLNVLSTRRNHWSATIEQFRSSASTGLFDHSNGHQNKITRLPVQPVERSEIDQHEGITDTEHVGFTASFDSNLSNDVLAEGSFELPFYNFRRRNTSQKDEVQDDSNTYDDICSSEAKLMSSKRRRLVRPSLHEEMHQNVKAEAEVKISSQKEEKTEVEISAQASLDFKNESKASVLDRFLDSAVPGLRTVRKYERAVESFEQNHVTSMEESLDYIPID